MNPIKPTPVKATPVKAAPKPAPVKAASKPLPRSRRVDDDSEGDEPSLGQSVVHTKPAASKGASRVTRGAARGGVTGAAEKIADMDAYTLELANELAELIDTDASYDQAKNKRTWYITLGFSVRREALAAKVFITKNDGSHFRVTLKRDPESDHDTIWNECSRAFGAREDVVKFFRALLVSESDASKVAFKPRSIRTEEE